MRLGTQTDTGDATGTVVRTAAVPSMDRRQIQDVLAAFQGPWWQTPPAYSAVKVRGRPAYWWTRRQQPVTLTKRLAHLFEVTLLESTTETIAFRVHCSAGTYVRVLAEAIAERLGTVGHLAHLMRLRVGQWTLEEAHPLSWVTQASPEVVTSHLRPIESLVARPQPC
jgi:tRNA pseudouridine55 synthase